MKLLTGGKIILKDRILERHSLLFNDRILSCVPESLFACADGIDAERFELRGAYVSPGFIHAHVHGAGGADAMDATDESMDTFSRCLAEHGVTAFLPTTVSSARERLGAAVENVRRAMKRQLPGAALCSSVMIPDLLPPTPEVEKLFFRKLDTLTDVIFLIESLNGR